MKKKLLPLAIILSVLVVSLCACGIYLKIAAGSVYSLTKNDVTVEFEVTDKMSVKYAARLLKQQDIIVNENLFYYCARFPSLASVFLKASPSEFSLKKGYYELSSKMTLAEVFKEVSSGKEKSVKVQIPEGLTISKIAKILDEAGLSHAADFESVALTKGEALFNKCGLDIKAKTVEGFLYPDTYQIPVTYDSEKIICLMINNFINTVRHYKSTDGIQDSKDLYETVILASIIEREYRVKEEAPSIAGVFKNRLAINMPLQSCATVEYIITEVLHKPHPKIIYFSDLEISNPYNTYKYPGLPPGPISNPGITSLMAACHPEKNNYLYFTLTDAGEGRHTFSSNLSSHNKATQEFKTKQAAGN
ncbi:endolytic transglycosylase MltG [Treponema sp.]|uniref:endolytic transglycosylase MltG n=1 Tax=Treponema sp. TaxID=166 RepID=UPI00298D79B7|nr:endolytic transglycosylase MltG [Treponema sp.]MCR5612957.1 endolytic transglycosylase MltG [Treponema sp.]